MSSANFDIEEFLNSLPDDITNLDLRHNNLTYIPDLSRFNKLTYLNVSFNQLTSLPLLPDSLKKLYCDDNQLTNLPSLPNSLKILICNDNQLTYLPSLPNSLQELECYRNKLTSLPLLPKHLHTLKI